MEVLLALGLAALAIWLLVVLDQRSKLERKRRRLLGPQGPRESPLEERLAVLLRDRGYPSPVTQLGVEIDKRFYRLDFAYPDRKIAIEADGRQHKDPVHARSDRQRDADLATEGWTTLRFTWADIVKNPSVVVSRLSDAGIPAPLHGSLTEYRSAPVDDAPPYVDYIDALERDSSTQDLEPELDGRRLRRRRRQ